MNSNVLKLLLGFALAGYSYACFIRPDLVLWLSVSPVLEKANPFRSVMLIAHGLIAGFAGVILIFVSLFRIFKDSL